MKDECKKDFERISEYLDGELNDDICREIENHPATVLSAENVLIRYENLSSCLKKRERKR